MLPQYIVNQLEELLDMIRAVISVSCKNKNGEMNLLVFSYPQGR